MGDDVRVIYKHFPLPNHPWAMYAAKASACVSLQSESAFWRLHDTIFADQARLSNEGLEQKLDAISQQDQTLNGPKFKQCMLSEEPAQIVSRDVALADRLQVNATPTVFINGVRKNGAIAPDELQYLIRENNHKHSEQNGSRSGT